MNPRRLTVIVSGMVAADPWQGGAAWATLQYVLGLQDLGHDVFLIEPVPDGTPSDAAAPLAASETARYFSLVTAAFGLEERAALLRAGTRETFGLPYGRLVEIAGRADVLLNLSGLLRDDELTLPVGRRVYVDLDPAFCQLWHAVEGIDMRFGGHTHFATVGLQVGDTGCAVPTCDRQWIKTLPPVVLDHWPVAQRISYAAATTVGNWRAYGSVEHEGVFYGQKAHSLRPLLALPSLTDTPFVLALGIHPDETPDLDALRENGWTLLDPTDVAGRPWDYQAFVQGSRLEFGLAKSGYVLSHSGWFSDRSACYLASGRPVVAQETGFSNYLPTGAGLFPFATADDVVAAFDEIESDYEKHSAAARDLAREHFDSARVLTNLLDVVSGSRP